MAAANAVGAVLDPVDDVAVLVLTSHGGPQGIGLVTQREQGVMTPRDVGRLLDATRARYRVLIVSACYSGVFASALADPRTLVITAAAADRSSFGCQDGATWTYFGDAFFNRSLRSEPRLDAAFAKARTLVTEREKRERFEPPIRRSPAARSCWSICRNDKCRKSVVDIRRRPKPHPPLHLRPRSMNPHIAPVAMLIASNVL